MDKGESSCSERHTERASRSDDFQSRIIAMFEGAALALMADYLRERDAAVRDASRKEILSEIERLAALRLEVERECLALEAAKQKHTETLLRTKEIEVRARKRVKRSARVVERYRKTFEEVRDRINGVLDEESWSESADNELESIVRLIDEVAELDPNDTD